METSNIEPSTPNIEVKRKVKNQKEDILTEALRITTRDRNRAYGPPAQEFSRLAIMWSEIIGVRVSAKQVALCMVALKINRALHSDKRDNWVDMAGYARCGFLVESNRGPEKRKHRTSLKTNATDL